MSFDGKTALVTGGSRGIGKAIAIAFANEGAKVALTSRNVERLEQVAAEIRDAGGLADCWRMDVSRETEVEEESQKSGAANTYHFLSWRNITGRGWGVRLV